MVRLLWQVLGRVLVFHREWRLAFLCLSDQDESIV
jgi:hypothetical protein